MTRTVLRRLAVLGGTLGVLALFGVGLAVVSSPRDVTTQAASASGDASPLGVASAGPETTAPTTGATEPTTAPVPAPGPATTLPKAPPTTVAHSSSSPSTSPTTAAPAAKPSPTTAPAAAAAPKVAPGVRVTPSSADVQAAVTQLHQRIPLFAPTDSQLLAFADAVCASFDRGQSASQVQATVQQAVSNIQGASLSAADAQFAVGIVVKLRCPGYLP